MTRTGKYKPKPNIGYEQRVFVRKTGAYYHTRQNCEMFLPQDFATMGYEEIRISRVPKGVLPCPFCAGGK